MRLTRKHLLLVAVLLLIGCKPIKVEICVLGPDGTAECTLSNGEQVSKQPSELENYIATNAQDFQKLVNACKKQKE